MVALKFFAALAALAQGALASPALAKRGEGIHLFNCRPWGGAGVTQTWLSLVVVRRVKPYPFPAVFMSLMLLLPALVLRERLGLQRPGLPASVGQCLRQEVLGNRG